MAKSKKTIKADPEARLIVKLNEVIRKSRTSAFSAIGALAALQVVLTSRMYNLCDDHPDKD